MALPSDQPLIFIGKTLPIEVPIEFRGSVTQFALYNYTLNETEIHSLRKNVDIKGNKGTVQ